MRDLIALLALYLTSITGMATTLAPEKIPPQLNTKIQHLASLLGDSYSSLCCTETQTVKLHGDHNGLVLALFTIESPDFRASNNYTQYLAIFRQSADGNGMPQHEFLDAIPVGSKHDKHVSLNAKVTRKTKGGDILITLDAMGHGENDASCCPSQPIKVNLVLKENAVKSQLEIRPH